MIEGEGTYESESNDVVHIRIDGRGPPQAVTAALVKAVPESCARAKQFAELCQAARGRSS